MTVTQTALQTRGMCRGAVGEGWAEGAGSSMTNPFFTGVRNTIAGAFSADAGSMASVNPCLPIYTHYTQILTYKGEN